MRFPDDHPHPLPWRGLFSAACFVIGAALVGSGSAAAQAVERGEGQGGVATPLGQQHLVRASSLAGLAVRNGAGEPLGRVEDVIVDVRNRIAHYAVISFGGVFGFGDKLFAYPLRMLRIAPTQDELVLDVERSRLEEAPGFEAGRWPEWTRSTYRSDLDRYFGVEASGDVGAEPLLMRAKGLIGSKVADRSGRHAAEIEDVILALDSGRVASVVLALDRDWYGDGRLLPVPPAVLDFGTLDDIVLRVSPPELQMSRSFERARWPNFNDPAYRHELDQYLRDGDVRSERR